MLAQQLLNGLALGSTYILIAIGLTMVYGVLKLLHFAHGVIYTIGAFSGMIGVLYLHMNFWVAILFAMLISGLAGMIVERYAYRSLRNVHPITTLISGVGIAIFIESLLQILFTADPRAFPNTGMKVSVIQFTSSISITNTKLYIILAGLLCLLLLYAFLKWTKLGVAIQATSQDMRAASLMGINVNLVVAVTFFLGSALAALAGVFVAYDYNSIFPTMGSIPGLKAFCVVILGGLGSIPGTIIGGLLLGMVESLSEAYLTGMVIDKDAIAFMILIVILLVKPSGLFGKNVEKV